MNTIKNNLKKLKKSIKNYKLRKKLKNKSFTVISNNCWGSFLYQDLGLEYNTPFVGLFLFAPDYIKLLKNLKQYLNCDLKFISPNTSKYKNELKKYGLLGNCPIGMLDDIEIVFQHYKTEEEAKEKWDRRLKRINWNNLFIKFSDRDLCNESLLEQFNNLNIKNKVCFTAKNHENLKSCVWLENCSDKNEVYEEWTKYKKYFDVISWLNINQK